MIAQRAVYIGLLTRLTITHLVRRKLLLWINLISSIFYESFAPTEGTTTGQTMTVVTECELPAQSKLHAFFKKGDFMDCFHVERFNPNMPLRKLAEKTIGNPPKYISALMSVRNTVVKPFGLKTDASQMGEGDQPVDAIGIFPVICEDENELILGANDKHLDFRLSLYRPSNDSHDLYVATWVHKHNLFGAAYLTVIMPFHKMIVRTITANMAKI